MEANEGALLEATGATTRLAAQGQRDSDQLHRAASELDAARATIDRLHRELSTAVAETERALSSNYIQSNAVANSKSETERHRREADAARRELATVTEELNELHDELGSMSTKNFALQAELTEANEMLQLAAHRFASMTGDDFEESAAVDDP